jgi:hypothetical protein
MSDLWLPHTKHIHLRALDHGTRPRTKGVVIHSTEGDSLPTEWFRSGSEGVGAHGAIDNHQAVQYVGLGVKCWHAVNANSEWIGLEHVAHASWARGEWLHHATMLHLSANRVAWILHEYGLGRPRWGLNIRTHASGGAAWGGHHDPGHGFPEDVYMHMCMEAYMGHWGRG